MTAASADRAALEWLLQRCQEYTDAELAGYRDHVFDAVAGRIHRVAGDPGLSRDTRQAIEDSIRLLLRVALPSGAGPETIPPVGMLDLARTMARRGMDLTDLLGIYRAGEAIFWRHWLADVTARIADRRLLSAVLDRSWEQLDGWCEHQTIELTKIFLDDQTASQHSGLARQTEFVESMLAGASAGVDEASVILRHELRRIQTAVVLWTPEPECVEPEAFSELRRGIAQALGAITSLAIPRGSTLHWLWIATEQPPPLHALATITALDRHPAARLAVGHPAPGFFGFRSSHREAELARRVAGSRRVVRYDEVELAALTSGDDDAVRALVARELGGLARRDRVSTTLRGTARTYLQCGMSTSETARALHTHRNTVTYRVRRIEELRGCAITERRLELEFALLLADVLGDRVLPSARRTRSGQYTGST